MGGLNLYRDEKRTERLKFIHFAIPFVSVSTYTAMKSGLKGCHIGAPSMRKVFGLNLYRDEKRTERSGERHAGHADRGLNLYRDEKRTESVKIIGDLGVELQSQPIPR